MERINTRVSVMDKITPAQGEAWEIEHDAIGAADSLRPYYLARAKDIRLTDLMERKRALYEYGDAQNEMLDMIAEIEGRGGTIPIFEMNKLATANK